MKQTRRSQDMSKRDQTIELARQMYEDLEGGGSVLHLYTPIKVISTSTDPDEYCLVIEDGCGYTHYFNPDGTYDGWEASLK